MLIYETPCKLGQRSYGLNEAIVALTLSNRGEGTRAIPQSSHDFSFFGTANDFPAAQADRLYIFDRFWRRWAAGEKCGLVNHDG